MTAYAGTQLWFPPSASAGGKPESPLCRFWLCPNQAVIDQAYQQYLQSSAEEEPKSERVFTEALVRDPASAYRWCDVGEILFEAGNEQAARYCFSRAVALGPNSSPILLRTANFFFRAEDHPEALIYTKRILKQVDQYDAMVFTNYDRLGVPVQDVLQNGIPVDRRVGQSYLRHLLGSTRVADVQAVWIWIRAHSFADDRLAAEYVNFLLRNHEYNAAEQSWAQYLGNRRGDYPHPNSLFNGSFEMAPTPSMLDWLIIAAEGAPAARDASASHAGQWSLRVHFEGTHNVAFSHVSQTVVAHAGAYRFSAYVKTDGITTDQGIGFHIFDPEAPARLDIYIEPLAGTADWKRVEKMFVAPAQTRLIDVQVVRFASRKFDNKIAGTAWIDSVALEKGR